MTHYKRHVTAQEGMSLRQLLMLLTELQVKHGVERLIMNKMLSGDGKDRKYLLEMYTK